MGRSSVRIDCQNEAWKQGSGALFPESDVDGLLRTLAAAPVDAKRRLVRVSAAVEDPVLADRGNQAIQLDVSDQVLVRIVLRHDLHDEDRADVLPPPLPQG